MGNSERGRYLLQVTQLMLVPRASVSSSGVQKRESPLVSRGTMEDSMALACSPAHSLSDLYNFAALLECSNLGKGII